MILEYPTTSVMVLGLKGKRSRSQGHRVQKHIEGDRVVGVSRTLTLQYPVTTERFPIYHLYPNPLIVWSLDNLLPT